MPRAFRVHPRHSAVNALVRLHADICGKLVNTRREADRLTEDTRHVEAVIRLFDPDHKVNNITPRRRHKANGVFKHGTLFRGALDVLRSLGEPMTTQEMVLTLFNLRGVGEPTKKQVRTASVALQSGLRKHEGHSVERVVRDGRAPFQWGVISD